MWARRAISRNASPSYFHRTQTSPKTAALMQQVDYVEVTVTNTEAEALILEYNLIKRHKPRFNVVLRDDKSYPYIYVSTKHSFPRLQFHRGPRKGKGRYFGPYPSTSAVRQTLNDLQKLFMVRQCQDSFFKNRSQALPAVPDQKMHRPVCRPHHRANSMRRILTRRSIFLMVRIRTWSLKHLWRAWKQRAAEQDYEQAARFRDQIARLKEVEARQLVVANGKQGSGYTRFRVQRR